MNRKRTEWKFRGNSLTLGERTLIVGVLNLTPDSFTDGGEFNEPEAAVQRALELQAQGADLIDIGAESTKPGSERISEAEESRRLIPVLKKLNGKLDIPISVDTYKPGIAELAFKYGVSIINDVSGLTWEPDLAKVVLQAGAGLILNHMRGKPEQWARMAPLRDVMGEIAAELEASIHRARRAGIDLNHIVIDPGIGFGKRREQNSEILARLTELRRLNLPVLVGTSRKSFLAQEDPRALEFATAAAVTAAILNGADLVRVHDVASMKPVVETTDAVIAAIPEVEEEERERRPAREVRRDQEREDDERKRPIRPPAARKRAPEPPPPAAPPPPERGERRPYSRTRDEGDERRPIRRDREDDRPRPPYGGDKPPGKAPFWADRPQGRGGSARPGGGDRPARPPRREGDDRPPRRSGPPRGDDRPPRRTGPPRGDDRPPRSGPPRYGDDRPPRPPRREGDDRPPRRSGPPRGGDDRPPSRSGPPRSGPPRSGPPRGRDDRPPSRGGGGKAPSRGGAPGGGRRGPSTPGRRG